MGGCVQISLYIRYKSINSAFTSASLGSDMHGVLRGKHSLPATWTLAELPFPTALSEPVLVQSSYLHHLHEGHGQDSKGKATDDLCCTFTCVQCGHW